MDQPEQNWVTVAEKSTLVPNSVIGVTIHDLDVAIYNVDGQLYATDNICPHAYGHLDQGWLEGDIIECPLHAARFEVRTGRGIDGPFERDLNTFRVRVVGEQIQIEVPLQTC